MNNEQAEKPKRGGARPGAGRTPLSPEQRVEARKSAVARRRANIRTKTIELAPDEVKKIESLAADQGISTHAWIVSAVRSALASVCAEHDRPNPS